MAIEPIEKNQRVEGESQRTQIDRYYDHLYKTLESQKKRIDVREMELLRSKEELQLERTKTVKQDARIRDINEMVQKESILAKKEAVRLANVKAAEYFYGSQATLLALQREFLERKYLKIKADKDFTSEAIIKTITQNKEARKVYDTNVENLQEQARLKSEKSYHEVREFSTKGVAEEVVKSVAQNQNAREDYDANNATLQEGARLDAEIAFLENRKIVIDRNEQQRLERKYERDADSKAIVESIKLLQKTREAYDINREALQEVTRLDAEIAFLENRKIVIDRNEQRRLERKYERDADSKAIVESVSLNRKKRKVYDANVEALQEVTRLDAENAFLETREISLETGERFRNRSKDGLSENAKKINAQKIRINRSV